MEKYPFRRHLLLPQLQVIFCRNIADTTEEHSQKWTIPWEKKMNKTMVFNSRCEWCDTFLLLLFRLFLSKQVSDILIFAFSLSQELWTPVAGEQLWYLSLHALHTFPTFTTGHHHHHHIIIILFLSSNPSWEFNWADMGKSYGDTCVYHSECNHVPIKHFYDLSDPSWEFNWADTGKIYGDTCTSHRM